MNQADYDNLDRFLARVGRAARAAEFAQWRTSVGEWREVKVRIGPDLQSIAWKDGAATHEQIRDYIHASLTRAA